MRRKITGTAAAVCLCVLSFSAGAADLYNVSMRLSENGKVLATPKVVVKNGTPATVTVTGPHAFKIGLVATGLDAGRIKLATDVHTADRSLSRVVTLQAGEKKTLDADHLSIALTASPKKS